MQKSCGSDLVSVSLKPPKSEEKPITCMSLAEQLSGVVCFTPGCLSVWAGTGQQTSVVCRNDASEFLSFQFVQFFIITDNKDGKITGVSTLLPFVTLTKSTPLAL